MRTPAFLAVLSLAACGDPTMPGFSSGLVVTSVSATTSGGSTTTGDTTALAEDESIGSANTGADTGTLRDVGTKVDFGSSQPIGCKGKVDLLLVISRQWTMAFEQKGLVASFSDFVDTINSKLEGFDVHIMTANPDGKWPGWRCETEQWACPSGDCGVDAQGYQCGISPDYWGPCDQVLGAGLTFNVGSGAANELCELYGGNRYIVNEEPHREQMLECIAKVGWLGDNPPMGEALVAALAPKINGPDGCNAGFLRTDALLVVVLISDTADDVSYTWPNHWYAKVMEAKKDPGAVVMLGIVPQALHDGDPEIPGCTYDDDPIGKLRSFIDMFPNHAYGDTCAPSYAPFFEEAADLIAKTCGAFVPQ